VTVTFDAFELDYGQRRLFRDGAEVHLSPKALQLLNLLIEKAPNAVSKQALYEALWPSTFVSETNLPGLIVETRTALGDDARHPRFVRTVHGYGYAFDAPLQHPQRDAGFTHAANSDRPRFALLVQGREVALGRGEYAIGRTASAAVHVEDPSVSREHAKIVDDGTAVTLIDQGSKNGTFVNGRRISEPTVLRGGDVIGIGSVAVVFRDGRASESTLTIGGVPEFAGSTTDRR
jgi:DNA-binding winged helix-turn-helix (wHTH) protein